MLAGTVVARVGGADPSLMATHVRAPAHAPSAAGDIARAVVVPGKPLAGLTVNLDPGHNPGNASHPGRINAMVDAGGFRKACDTTGTAGGSYSEAVFTLQLAHELRALLVTRGATVTLTRDGAKPAWGPCITERATIGNRADVAVSLHADGNLAPGARGFHVIVPAPKAGYTSDILPASAVLGRAIRNALLAKGQLPASTYLGHAGLDVRADLGGLNRSDVPKVLVENGNMRNAEDLRVLRSVAGRRRIARAIADGLGSWQRARTAAGTTDPGA